MRIWVLAALLSLILSLIRPFAISRKWLVFAYWRQIMTPLQNQLFKMIKAYDHNHNRFAQIIEDMRNNAELVTRTDRPKTRQYSRNKATWTGADEEYYLTKFFELVEIRKSELASLKAKMQRQACAIKALVKKHGFNRPPELRTIPPVHPGIDARTNYSNSRFSMWRT